MSLPIGLPILNATNGPILPIRYCKPPSEGPRACQVKITFPAGGALASVSLNQGQLGGASMSQISALFVDNTRSNQILTIQVPDSGQIISIPGYTRSWVNLLTGGLSFFATMVPDFQDTVVEITCVNVNVTESSDTIIFVDGLEKVFDVHVTNNPNPANFNPGQEVFFAPAPSGFYSHISTVVMQRINWRVLQTVGTPGQGERWELFDSSNGGAILAQFVFEIVTASLTVFYSDTVPYYSNMNFNYLTAAPGASLGLLNAGQSEYDGLLTFSMRYGYYNFPMIT